MSVWGGSPEEMRAQVKAQVEAAQERAAAASRLRADLDALRVRVFSPRREVMAEVDSAGRLTGLELTDAAVELGPSRLAQVVLATTRQAHGQAAARTGELAGEVFGEDSDLAERIRAAAVAQVATPPARDGITW